MLQSPYAPPIMQRDAEPAATLERSLWQRNRWLLARRASQLLVLALFLLGPWAGVWLARGSLASGELFGVLRLTDPLVALQTLLARHMLEGSVLGGAVIVAVLYTAFGGRSYCAWVCPVNPVTDLAAWLRGKLRLPSFCATPRQTAGCVTRCWQSRCCCRHCWATSSGRP
ncbi:4Fe-4S binding protein [Candidatus Aalborgicola defluviihabitans]|uniref:4Fe-4S binding protein n=1 Tax=Candidatus Aalborgicola defluviihabitans TaxID=3386187 RepID=UPI0039B85C87